MGAYTQTSNTRQYIHAICEGQKQSEDKHLEKGGISLGRGSPKSLPRTETIREAVKGS